MADSPKIPAIDEPGTATVFRTSELGLASKCMRAFGYMRYFGSVRPHGVIGGIAIDDALTEHNTQKVKGKNGLRGTALTDFFRERLRVVHEAFQRKGPLTGEPDLTAEYDGTRLLPMYEAEIDPHVEPISTQEACTYTNEDGITLVGHLDLTRQAGNPDEDGHKIVSDYKFTKKTPKQMDPVNTIAMPAYDMMRGDGSGHVEFILLRRLKRSPEVVTTSGFIKPKDHTILKKRLSSVAAMFARHLFPPTDPTHWMCTERWCGFWDKCRGRADGPAPLPGEEGWEQKG